MMKRWSGLIFLFFQSALLFGQEWKTLSPFVGTARDDGVAFVINGIAYAGTGREVGFGYTNDFYKYDPSADEWTKIAPLPSVGRQYCGRFTIADTGYVVCGVSPDDYLQELWAYYPHNDSWEQKASFPGEARSSPVAFGAGGKAYVGTGREVNEYFGDFWEYNPKTDSWTQLADFAGGDRFEAIGMTIGPFAYVGLGRIEDRTFARDWWKFNPENQEWIRMDDYPGRTRFYSAEGSNGQSGIIAGGMSEEEVFLNEVYSYSPLTDEWRKIPDLPVVGIRGGFVFAIENAFHYATGLDDSIERRDEVYRIEIPTLQQQILGFPNPASERITFSWSHSSLQRIEVFDISGRIVFSTENIDSDYFSLNLGTFPEGVFIARFTMNGGIQETSKFLKVK
jgi:N-acetylneuraminic acid mutarotase